MEWHPSTLAHLPECFKNERYKTWADAIESGQMEKYSEKLDELLERLSSILASEICLARLEQGCTSHEETMAKIRGSDVDWLREVTEKIHNFMDMAALAGKTM